MSMAIQFDTLRYVETLKSAGVPEAQAKAEASALSTALGESTTGLLATKDDINGIKFDLLEIKSEQKLIKWMLGALIAGVVSLVIKSFF